LGARNDRIALSHGGPFFAQQAFQRFIDLDAILKERGEGREEN
jgi:hypothetical protein